MHTLILNHFGFRNRLNLGTNVLKLLKFQKIINIHFIKHLVNRLLITELQINRNIFIGTGQEEVFL